VYNLRMQRNQITPKRKRGRPPAGVGADGSPEIVRRYPRLTISLKPGTRLRLEAASTATGQSTREIIEQALAGYLERLPDKQRKAIEATARCREEQKHSTGA